MTPGVLLIDNFDSFTYNLVDEFAKRGCSVSVWRNKTPANRLFELALAMPCPRLVVLSPGPGTPRTSGSCLELTRLAAGCLPIFGVCLGYQALIEAFGGAITVADEIVHGKSSSIDHDGQSFFADLPQPLTVGRYHSLVATRVPSDFVIRARHKNTPMAIEHRHKPIAGVQFHPESILTPQGGCLIEGVLRWATQHEQNQAVAV